MKKFVLFLILVVSMVATCFAYERGTCTIQNGNGATVIAEVSGGGHNVVYLNFYNDASSYVNVTVTVKVSNGGVTRFAS